MGDLPSMPVGLASHPAEHIACMDESAFRLANVEFLIQFSFDHDLPRDSIIHPL
jgi:hypothetical protein